MVERRTLVLGIGALAVAALLVALAVIGPGDFFLAEESTAVSETPVDGDGTVLKRGTFTGTDGHEVGGTVSLVRTDDGLVLQFRNYTQTPGPDVFVYVTPAATPDTSSEIGAGRRVPIDGGEDGGESTKTGTFSQPLPDDVDPDGIGGVGVWCDQFGVPFGYAALNETG